MTGNSIMTDSNVVDPSSPSPELDIPGQIEAWDALHAMHDGLMRQPQELRRGVDGYRLGELHGRDALVADIRRELAVIEDALDKGRPTGNGGGLIWRLAMLGAHDSLGATD
jgi:hypothetical protein